MKISTHTLTWSVTITLALICLRSWNFNSHAHVERDQCLQRFFLCLLNFNSHAHVERDIGLIVLLCVKGISTHTLTWSVTNCSNCCCKILIISTHTLTWSVTITSEIRLPYLSFQLTRSRGAWLFSNSGWVLVWNFNSHAHVERDKIVGRRLWPTGISTHTLTWSVT